jgi:ABC-type cobalamin/Fe3+-siderophores transport system ATPase subunit
VVVRRAADLSVGHGRTTVLRGIDLDIRRGETLAIVGANGSGKTTLLRALAGLLPPLAGNLTWPAGLPPHGKGMLMPQDEPVAPFSVRELVTLGLGGDGPPSPAQRGQVDRLLADFGLTPLAERPCAAISGGEWQRARLARALISRPSLVLFDEPTNHLDPAARAQLLDLCLPASCSCSCSCSSSIPGRAAAALVLATHDLDLATRCDRALLLASGTALASGPAGEALTPALLARALEVPFHRQFAPGDPMPFFRAEVCR